MRGAKEIEESYPSPGLGPYPPKIKGNDEIPQMDLISSMLAGCLEMLRVLLAGSFALENSK